MRIAIALLLAVLVNPACAQNRTVALTFDDLPLALAGSPTGVTPAERIAETREVNLAIVKGLRKNHAPAIAFVNENKVVADGQTEASRDILREWTKAGFDLGNHTFAHRNLSTIAESEFEREVVEGEASVKMLMTAAAKPLRYLRFPSTTPARRRRSTQPWLHS